MFKKERKKLSGLVSSNNQLMQAHIDYAWRKQGRVQTTYNIKIARLL